MIRSLRRRHRVITVALALTVPALFAAGLAVREPVPAMALPEVLSGPTFDPADALSTQLKNTGSGLALRITTLAPAEGARAPRLAVELLSDPARPELLVYWQAGSAAVTTIADDAYLLGALSGSSPGLYRLPNPAATTAGSLVFYSLAQQEVVDRVALRRSTAAGEAP